MKINIHNIDLNLLAIFDALMIHRSVTKAAHSVNVSQSAMSHSLKRLRILLDDPVLVKSENGMRPTPRAMTLELPIREVLTQIKHNLYAPEPFDPMKHTRTFVIFCTEYFECVYLPLLIAKFEKEAPGVKVKLGILTSEIPEKELINGKVDFVVGVKDTSEVPRRMCSKPWAKDSLTCIVRKQNPDVGSRIHLNEYTKISHICHTTLGTPFSYIILDKWLERNGIRRQFAVTTTGYLSAAMIVSETNCVLTLPARLAKKLVRTMNLRIVEPPEDFPEYKLNLIWHPLYEKDPACQWFRKQLVDLVGRKK